MKIAQKLVTIQEKLELTQTQLAQRFGVSFATLNSWINSKSIPRAKKQALIDDLFLEVTGEKSIPKETLEAKKQILQQKSTEHKNIVNYILDNPDIRDQFILKLTYHSNSIEGSTLTEPDTAAVLFGNVALPNKSIIEQLEAKNHQAALNYTLDYVLNGEEIDQMFVLKIHSILMNGIRPDAGQYRNHAVRIMGVNLATANYMSLDRLMPEVMKLARNKTEDIINLSAEVHSQFEKIHPFSDGNGRVGRLLMNAMLLEANVAPAIIRQEEKQLYYAYLYKSQTQEDTTQLENFIFDAVIEGFKIIERKDI